MSKKDKTTIKELKNVEGMLALTYEHEVKSTKYSFRWDGPKIPKEEWQKMKRLFQKRAMYAYSHISSLYSTMRTITL